MSESTNAAYETIQDCLKEKGKELAQQQLTINKMFDDVTSKRAEVTSQRADLEKREEALSRNGLQEMAWKALAADRSRPRSSVVLLAFLLGMLTSAIAAVAMWKFQAWQSA